MLRTLADRADTRPHLLLHAGSRSDRLTGREAIGALAAALTLSVVPVLTEPDEGWTGERGYVTPELLARHLPGDRMARHYFVCGPPAMIRSVRRNLRSLGVPRSQIHSELFDMF